MAALTGASQCPTNTDLQCLMHIESVRFETVKALTNIRWFKVTSCAKEWLDLSGRDSEIAGRIQHMGLLDEGLHYDQACVQQQKMMGFHDTCYRRFVDSKRIAAARKRTVTEEPLCDLTPKKRRKRSRQASRSSGILPVQCIICGKRNSFMTRRCKRVQDKLQQAETFDGGLLRQAAERKRDEHILMHIRGKDCVAIEVRYHSQCYKNYIRFLHRRTETDPERGQLEMDYQVAYELFCGTTVQPRLIDNEEIMRMTKLVQLFVLKIKEHEGADLLSYRSDKLKYRLQRDYPQLCFHRPFRRNKCEIVYTDALSPGSVMENLGNSEDSSTGTSEVEMDTPTCSYAVTGQDSMRMLYNAGMILKNAIKQSPGLTCPWPPTSSDLTLDSARELVPLELFNFMAWCTGATEEPCLKTVADVSCKDETNILSLCQDIIYAASNGRKQTPKSLSLGLTVRHLTGSSQLLRLLNNFGHCSSWDTIIGLETSLAQLQLATSHKVPKGFLEKAPTVLVWDNIDFGEETVSGHGTTHHTNGIMIQSHISEQTELNDRPKVKKGVRSLTPTMTPMETFISVGRKGPKLVGDVTLVNSSLYSPAIRSALQKDFIFLLSKFLDGKSEVPGWTGFNISLSGRMTLQKSAIHYLPVIEASPTEMTTINTIIHRSLSIADNLQLEHICLVFDQAIYAKVQQIRWSRDDVMKRTVVRLGELHTCMSYMGIIGKRFGDAGLRDLLIESEVVAAGSIIGVLSGHHYNRSVHSHKLMYEALQRMRFSAFKDTLTEEEVQKYSSLLHPGDVNVKDIEAGSPELSDLMGCYDKFVTRKNSESPTFALWSSYIDMVQLLLVFIRATRESDWHMHLAAIRFMMPWFFAYDRTNYSRYLPPYWVEMVNLPTTHPRCYEEVSKRGEWTVQRQDRHPFASIACDQAIEQTCNRDSKTRGGITSFTLNRGAVQRWILSQPERSAVTRQCELLSGLDHHGRLPKELDSARTKRDDIAVDSIISTVSSMINPFDCSTEDLVCISSGVVASDRVKDDLMNAVEGGEADTVEFIRDRLIENKVDLFSAIKQKKLKTFSENSHSVGKTSTDVVKQNRVFFARLLVVGQKRKIDLPEVLSYSLGSVSFPFASASGTLAKTDKSALLHAIEDQAINHLVREVPSNAAILIDGLALIQSMREIPETFGELAGAILQQVCGLATKNKCSRVDFVTDCYPAISIKNTERARRAEAGSQTIKIYSKDQKTPKQFKKFLSNGSNKEALIDFLLSTWREASSKLQPRNLIIFTTSGEHCYCLEWKEGVVEASPCLELFCDHEEADTRLLLHAAHASLSNQTVIIKSPDTDVAIIALTLLDSLPGYIYFMTGKGNKSRIIDLQKVRASLSTSSKCLIGLHIFTGCDSTSAFYGKGKQKALKVLEEHPEFQESFCNLGSAFQLQEQTLSSLEKFVCLLYGQSAADSVDDARYKVFCSSPSSEQSLPPTKDALIQHVKRCTYQAAIHHRALQPRINAPSPDGHGWKLVNDELLITWMTRPPAPDVLLQCVSCSCKVGKCLKGRCSCMNAQLPCTDLCKCKNCSNFQEDVEIVDAGEDDLEDEL